MDALVLPLGIWALPDMPLQYKGIIGDKTER